MAECYDPAYEFDAPKYCNFRRTSLGDSCASQWFDCHEATPDKQALVLTDVSNIQQEPKTANKPAAGPTAVNNSTVNESDAKRPKANIVTSWGPSTAATKLPTTEKKNQAITTVAPASKRPQQKKVRIDKENVAPAATKTNSMVKPATAQSTTIATASKRRKTAQASELKPATDIDSTPIAQHSPRITRSVTKKRLEEAALQYATDKARDNRMGRRAVKTALNGTRISSGSSKRVLATKPTATKVAAKPKRVQQPSVAGGVRKPQAAPKAQQVARKGPQTSAASKGTTTSRVARPAMASKVGASAAATTTSKRVGVPAALPVGRSSRDRLMRALRPRTAVTMRSTKPLTMPQEPHLHASRATRCLTIQESGKPGTPFKPLAVKVKEFQTKTPARFRTKATPADPPKPLVMTHAQEPVLITAVRARPSTMKPSDIEEQEAMAALPPFTAQPFRAKMFKSGAVAPPVTERKPLTEPQPFNFVTDDRAARRQGLTPQQGEGKSSRAAAPVMQFKALPLKNSILEAPATLPKRARMSLTIPVSPLLLTKTRTQQHHHQEAKFEEEQKQDFKARPVPHFLHVPPEFHAIRELPTFTEPQPFALRTELRGAAHQTRLQAAVREQEEAAAKARQMKAQPLPPTTEVPALPARPEPRPLTVPEPFALQSEVRHGDYVHDFQQLAAQKEEQARQDAIFKARPMWRGIPYQLHPADAPLTVPQELQLATEHRAVQRQEFDTAMDEKIRAQEEAKAAAAEAAARAEAEAVKEYRRSLRFKAHPVPKFGKPKPVEPSKKPLTQPRTPKLGRKRKADDVNLGA